MISEQYIAIDEGQDYISRIQTQYNSLSKKQKKIARYIFTHRDEVINHSIGTIAKKIGTSPATVTRFCQALSFKGFSELKVFMEKNFVSSSIIETPINSDDSTSVIIQQLQTSAQNVITDTLRTLSPEVLQDTVNTILSANTINLYGQSGGSISAMYAQQLFLRVGVLSQALNDSVDMHIAASTLKRGDVAIGFGYSGEGRSVVNALSAAKENGAKVIAITANPKSTMAKLANHVLLYSYNIPDDIRYLHLGSICEIGILGAIQAEILRRPDSRHSVRATKDIVLESRIK